jgi:hypothetical protein
MKYGLLLAAFGISAFAQQTYNVQTCPVGQMCSYSQVTVTPQPAIDPTIPLRAWVPPPPVNYFALAAQMRAMRNDQAQAGYYPQDMVWKKSKFKFWHRNR